MKILVNVKAYSDKFVGLANALQSIPKVEIGFVNGSISSDIIQQFKPNLLVHNDLDNIEVFDKSNIFQILLHENQFTDHKLAYNIANIPPFIDTDLLNKVEEVDRYKCDIGIIGDLSLFNGELMRYLSFNYRTRIFNPSPTNTIFYNGSIPRRNYPSFYRSSKVSPFSIKDDPSRLYEIICSDGNPVIFDPDKVEKFHTDIQNGLDGGRAEIFISKEEILSKYTSIHMMKLILDDLGLQHISSLLGKS